MITKIKLAFITSHSYLFKNSYTPLLFGNCCLFSAYVSLFLFCYICSFALLLYLHDIWCLSFSVWHFTWHITLLVHSCYRTWKDSIYFYCWVIFLSIHWSSFFILPSIRWYLACFHVLAIVSSAAMNMGKKHIHFLISVFVSFGKVPRSRIVGSYGNSILIF